MAGIYPLEGTIKHYDWGGFSFIPSLLQVENKEGRPFAEYWMGTHPLANNNVIVAGIRKALTTYSNSLPFLLKVLDVNNMLSIQVHPTKKDAEKGYAMENAAGIPIDSPNRNYKDDNHKPEMMVALSDFWLLHGFKPIKQLEQTLLQVDELKVLLPVFKQLGYEGLYRHVMEMPQQQVNEILQPLLNKLKEAKNESEPDKTSEAYWVLKAANTFALDSNIDRGIFSIYLFNLVQLQKGEGIFQSAGVPHAYLQGQNVELMANSDNVLRGGLTTKYIDVNELLKHVKCEATLPAVLHPESINNDEKKYISPVDDFQLNIIELLPGQAATLTASLTEILLLTEGEVELSDSYNKLKLLPGAISALVLPGTSYKVKAIKEATVYRAFTELTPVNK